MRFKDARYFITRKPVDRYDISERFAAGLSRGDMDDKSGYSVRVALSDGWQHFYHFNTILAIMSDDGLTVHTNDLRMSITTSRWQSELRWKLHQAGFRETGKASWRDAQSVAWVKGDDWKWTKGTQVWMTEWKRKAKDRDEEVARYMRKNGFDTTSKRARDRAYDRRDQMNSAPHLREAGVAVMKELRDNRRDRAKSIARKKTLYKVLDKNMCAKDGGSFQYELGEWTPVIKYVAACVDGYHVTEQPVRWARSPEDRIFVVEVDLDHDADVDTLGDDKLAFSSIRLVEEITNDHKKLREAGMVLSRQAIVYWHSGEVVEEAPRFESPQQAGKGAPYIDHANMSYARLAIPASQESDRAAAELMDNDWLCDIAAQHPSFAPGVATIRKIAEEGIEYAV